VCVLYCSEVDRFRVGLGAPMKVNIYILFFFLQMHANHQIKKQLKTMEDPSRRKVTLKGYFEHQKVTSSGPDQASICDELGVRMGGLFLSMKVCCGWLLGC